MCPWATANNKSRRAAGWVTVAIYKTNDYRLTPLGDIGMIATVIYTEQQFWSQMCNMGILSWLHYLD